MTSDLKSKVVKGAFWLTLSTWIVSSLGIVSTLILARILLPEDFGLIATATIVTGFFDLFAKLGTMQYIVNKQDLVKEDINTAWTIQLVSQILIASLVYLSSDYAALYFNDARLEFVLKALALIPLCIGLKNVGLVLLQKKLEFKRIVFIQSGAKFLSFLALVITAYLYQSYWAFVIGMLVQHFCISIFSYVISNHRPRLCLAKCQEQFSFSSWVLLKGFVNYAGNKADAFLISKYLSIDNVGYFNLGTRIATIPNDYLLKPLDNVIYSGLAESLSEKELFFERCQKTLLFIFFLTIPICCLPLLSSTEIVTLFLGDAVKWSTVVDLLPFLSFLILLLPVWSRLYDFITLIGEVKRVFFLDCVYATLSISALVAAIYYGAGLLEIIWISLAVRFIFILYLMFVCHTLVNLNITRIVIFVAPLVFSAIGSAWLVFYSHSFIEFDWDFIQLIANSGVFVICYALLTALVTLILKNSNPDYLVLSDTVTALLRKAKLKSALY
ncbi:lipopolysaccharide biosynthesis protein [Catenovulum maritimum]|uniref:Polysaccharide biosynthesis protein C-terminal domain-containing protein n=1 Tax=Catenovulum maritimum TaxID=1513271 RepID=A0A0J8GPA7_9ALTE|nr:lipopolysaccharide biosynthesis protein [Catenovulum maritimum]KMT64635.1 hypothetical protein XM47_13415 [Catenovulum maritimum]